MDVAMSRPARWSLRGFFVLLVFFLYAPIVILAIFSLNDGLPSFPMQGFTTRWYRAALANPNLLDAIKRSIIVATVSSTIAVALAILLAFALLRRRFVGKSAVSALVFSPLVIPYVVFGISLLILFATVDRFLTRTMGTYIGLGLHAIVIGHVVVSLPYAILTIIPLLERLPASLDEAAKDLGAGPWSTFRRVTLPLLAPALVSAFLISFTLSFDEYAIASFLSGPEPTWPVFLFGQLRVATQIPQLLAVSSVVLLLSLALVVVAEFGRRAVERRTGVGAGTIGS